GGMRQAGVLAAAGLIAIREMPAKLKDDHLLARKLAEQLAEIEGVEVDLRSVQTNLVYVSVPDAEALSSRLADQGVLCNALTATRMRFATHHQVDERDAQQVVEAVREVAGRAA